MHVLVVENDPDVLETVVNILHDSGVIATCTPSLQIATAILATGELDVVLSDLLFLGPMTGLHLADRAVARGIPCIIMSGSAEKRAETEARGLPFLAKPFHRAELLAALGVAPA